MELIDYPAGHGVMVSPGSFHYFGPSEGIHFRISIAYPDEAAIVEGIRHMGKALDQLTGKTKRCCKSNV